MSELATLGVIGTSRKAAEARVPIHPRHFTRIPSRQAARLIFEQGYGERFRIDDSEIADWFGGVASREELLATCDGVILPKPLPADLHDLHEGGLLWGWPHCIQQQVITEVAVARRQTLLAFESMHRWRGSAREMHLFYRNNELAGYCGVLHAFALFGIDGFYGPTRNAVVLSLGSVSRGAIRALVGRGLTDITVFTQRPPLAVRDRVEKCRYGQIVRQPDHSVSSVDEDGRERPLIDVLAEADVIVNGILQDTDRPLMFMEPGDERHLKDAALIIDVSCDAGMGFPFARATSFADPTFRVGRATYYAIDHTPSYLWRAASWEISEVVVAYLERVLGGPDAWERDESVRRALEIRDGKILNPKIISYREAHR